MSKGGTGQGRKSVFLAIHVQAGRRERQVNPLLYSKRREAMESPRRKSTAILLSPACKKSL